jgi:ribosome-binding factor A
MRAMKTSERSRRVASVLKEKIPPLFQQFLSPNQVGFVTVTEIEVAGDLGMADVFVRSIGGPKDFIKAIQKVGPKMEYEVSQQVQLRRPMKLRFRLDQSAQATGKIKEFL